jgi:hypothetical protein
VVSFCMFLALAAQVALSKCANSASVNSGCGYRARCCGDRANCGNGAGKKYKCGKCGKKVFHVCLGPLGGA